VLTASLAHARKPHPVHVLLDQVHEAASKADFDGYFDLFTPSALFVGTDAGEVWSIGEFKDYTRPVFAKGKGWTYHPEAATRRVRPLGGGSFRFYETLRHERYGVLRGSGVVVTHEGRLRVDQYVLSFAIPNEKTPAVLKAMRQQATSR